MNCVICNSAQTSILYTEKNEEFGDLRNYVCHDCNTIFCPDMNEIISPDYIDIEISDDHIWLQSLHKYKAFNQFVHLLSSRMIKVDTIVDYGCGTGGFLRFISEKNLATKQFGFDFSEKEINTAKELSSKAVYKVVNSLKDVIMTVTDVNRKSIITMWDVLEHIRRPINFGSDLHHFDYVFISVPSAEFQRLKFKLSNFFGQKPYFMSHEHITYFSRKGLEIFVERSGFKIVENVNIEIYERKQRTLKNRIRSITYGFMNFIGFPPQIGVLAERI